MDVHVALAALRGGRGAAALGTRQGARSGRVGPGCLPVPLLLTPAALQARFKMGQLSPRADKENQPVEALPLSLSRSQSSQLSPQVALDQQLVLLRVAPAQHQEVLCGGGRGARGWAYYAAQHGAPVQGLPQPASLPAGVVPARLPAGLPACLPVSVFLLLPARRPSSQPAPLPPSLTRGNEPVEALEPKGLAGDDDCRGAAHLHHEKRWRLCGWVGGSISARPSTRCNSEACWGGRWDAAAAPSCPALGTANCTGLEQGRHAGAQAGGCLPTGAATHACFSACCAFFSAALSARWLASRVFCCLV